MKQENKQSIVMKFGEKDNIVEKNEKDNIIKKTIYNPLGTIPDYIKIHYNKKGEKVKQEKKQNIVIDFDEKDNIVEKTIYHSDWNYDYINIYYNKKGEKFEEIKFLGEEREIDYIATFIDGHLFEIIYYEDNKIVIIKECIYNDEFDRVIFKDGDIRTMREDDKEYKKTLYNNDGTIKYFKRY